MPEWSRKFNECLNCASTHHKHAGKGYCLKCYPIAKSLETVNSWDKSDPKTLKTIPGVSKVALQMISESNNFEASCAETIRQLENRHRLLAKNINPENITASDIEHILQDIAESFFDDKKRKMFHGHTALYEQFQQDNLNTLFSDLSALLLAKRFSLNLMRIMSPERF
jgi:hypothetical protein